MTRLRTPRFERAAFTALILLPFVAACSGGNHGPVEGKDGGPKRREAARVRTAPIEQREMVRTLSTTTVVESEREIKIYPRTAGVVTDVHVEEGDRVEANALLATLDRRRTRGLVEEAQVQKVEAEDGVRKADIQKSEAEARIAQMQLKWEQACRDYDRNEKAALISQQALDNLRVLRDSAKNDWESSKLASDRAAVEAKASRTALEKAELALKRVELDDSYMLITAPFGGVIASRSMRVGDAVGPASAVFVLTDVSNLRAVFHRPQRELALFLHAVPENGDGKTRPPSPLEIRVVAEALPGVVFRGDLHLVSPSIDAASGSFRVTVKLGPPLEGAAESRLLPGMLVRLEIITDRHPEALVVPKRALRREGEQNLLFVVDANKVKRIEVEEGFADDASVEVHAKEQGALVAGAHVVVVGNRELEDGAEIIEEGAAAPVPAPATEELKTTGQADAAPGKG
jgi:membrane fusion protein (multidrug efflux system)